MSSSSYKYLYLTFFLLHLTILVAGDSPQPYLPLDNIALDCGSSSQSFVNNRNWTADISSKVALLVQDSGSIPSTANEASTSTVPYHTARVSHSQFTYLFPVTTAGPKFVRLHFYPASYPGFNRSKASFSVTTGRYTFLSNFSGVHYTEPHGEARGYAREFILNVEDERKNLSITFTPSAHVADAYAFINGIEIVSMPTNLYYTAGGMKDFDKEFDSDPLQKETALEMMYRVNVGGAEITPPDDTGMFRTWLSDTDYLTDARPSAFQYNSTIQLQYNNDTRYAAPDQLYRTARTMGPNATVNAEYNMTWEFPVHSTFTYLVRLHFCQFIPMIFQKDDLVFKIYIANQTAEPHADIIDWAGGNGVPVYKDYAVMMDARGNEEVQNLSIALHPIETKKAFDAMLNGVEIFKLSNSSNLSGPNPGAYEDSPTSATSSKPKLSSACPDYLTDARPGVYQYNDAIELQYNNDTRYAAPDALYRTARTMGNNTTVNAEYNLTWEFPVHSTFTYLVRLHFCQIIPILWQKGDLAFEIYIANQTAEPYLDIVDWAGGYGVPKYKDYSVMMDARGNEDIQNLSIAVHPIPSNNALDAMLNGVEIFKLSNSENLSGPNPGAYEDSPTSTPPSATSSKPNSRRRTAIIFGAAVSGLVVVSVLFFLIFRRRVLKFKEWVSGGGTSKLSPAFSSSTKSMNTQSSSDLFSTGSELVVNSRILEMATTSCSDEQSFQSSESEKMMSGAVFSEIMNSKGR
ncbi:hypothetical protein OIU76_028115 [Salix suchowensis]|nr:hypothetical protein OIU76_028115 [Salix suchowensis]